MPSFPSVNPAGEPVAHILSIGRTRRMAGARKPACIQSSNPDPWGHEKRIKCKPDEAGQKFPPHVLFQNFLGQEQGTASGVEGANMVTSVSGPDGDVAPTHPPQALV